MTKPAPRPRPQTRKHNMLYTANDSADDTYACCLFCSKDNHKTIKCFSLAKKTPLEKKEVVATKQLALSALFLVIDLSNVEMSLLAKHVTEFILLLCILISNHENLRKLHQQHNILSHRKGNSSNFRTKVSNACS